MTARRPMIAGNWKMNAGPDALHVIEEMVEALTPLSDQVDCLICPPATILAGARSLTKGKPVRLGGQDCHHKTSGPHTGCLSADMLGERLIDRMVEIWLKTEFEGGRHARRIEKINELEKTHEGK